MTIVTEPPNQPATKLQGLSLNERIESLKAGILSGIFATLTFAGARLAYSAWLPNSSPFGYWQPDSLDFWMRWAIASLSGFLFGVTYRYVIRQDPNPHLKSGAVLAFGLVRGLAHLDAGLLAQTTLLPALTGIGESILLFAAARIGLDWAMRQGWVKPFQA